MVVMFFAFFGGAGFMRQQGAPDSSGSCPESHAHETMLSTADSLARHGASLSAARGGRFIRSRRVEDVASALFRSMSSALTVFQSAGDALRMIVTPARVTRIYQKEDYVAVHVVRPVPLKTRSGRRPICVKELVIPLSGEWTEKDWTFFYRDGDAGEWFAVRWSNPDPSAQESLKAHLKEAFGTP
jgi:hypothetical protein